MAQTSSQPPQPSMPLVGHVEPPPAADAWKMNAESLSELPKRSPKMHTMEEHSFMNPQIIVKMIYALFCTFRGYVGSPSKLSVKKFSFCAD